jgi:hypothetical protein
MCGGAAKTVFQKSQMGFRSYGPARQGREYMTDPNDQDCFNLLCNAGRFSTIGSRLHYIL